MKRTVFFISMSLFAAFPAYALEQIMFSNGGMDAERAMLKEHTIFASNLKAGVIKMDEVSLASADVNGDETKELFVYDGNSFSCGSHGCSVYVLQKKGKTYRTIMEVQTGDTMAVGDKSSKNNGYKDIYLKDMKDGHPIRWSFNGKRYVFND